MSAQNNHKRFQRKGVKHIPEVSEIKEYQKDLRKKTFKAFVTTCAAILLIITVPIIFKNRFAHSKTYAWVQTSWLGGVAATYANAVSNLTNWTNYSSIVPAAGTGSGAVTANGSGVTLSNVGAQTVTETGGTYSGSLTNGSGMYPSNVASGPYVANGSMLNLKKPQGASCSNAAECVNNSCISISGTNECCVDACCGATPSANGITYGTVVGADGKCWLASNLGTSHVATSLTDAAAYGWYYQWGRGTDGHQISNSSTSTTLITTCSTSNPFTGNANFITTSSGNYDWCSPQDTTHIWQCTDSGGTCTGPNYNDPCPTGFHVPTQTEWSTLVSASPSITGDSTAFSSALKLTDAGYRYYNGTLYNQGSYGYYWSSSPFSTYSYGLYFYSGNVSPATNFYRGYGFSVRCVKN